MSKAKETHHQTTWWTLAVVLSTVAVSLLVFKAYVYAPNKYMYAFGGDALVIYYDMIFHAAYGKGPMLTAMNYPFGEYIYMTDAQGAIANTLQLINRYLFDLTDYIPGIIHALNIFLLPLCSLFLFSILKQLGSRNLSALVFSVLITFLSPQILRLGGHFGLAYPFVVPMAMWWFLRKFKNNRFEKRDLLVLATLVFFTYNNPYVGFAAAGFLLCAAGVLALMAMRQKEYLKKAAIIGSLALLAMLIPYLDFHLFDPVNDRIKQQWGFFFYHSSFEGMFYPPSSLLHQFLKSIGARLPEIQVESWNNVGLVAEISLAMMLIYWIVSLIKIGGRGISPILSVENKVLLAAASLMFIYASNTSLVNFSSDWLEEHLGPLLMFKASGRMAWPFYFALTVTAVVFLEKMLHRIKSPLWSYGLVLAPALIWAVEIRQYVGPKYKDCFHANFFHPKNRADLMTILRDQKIDFSEFQAMLVVPKMMAWTDHFLSELNWSAQFYSMRISAATGLPMINAMLSRMSIGQSAEAIQLLSNPLVKRELLPKLPNRKDILLLVGVEHPPLTVGEQYLIDISTPLYLSPQFSLYRLKIQDLEQSQAIIEAQNLYAQKPPVYNDIIHFSFDGQTSQTQFYGQGAQLVPSGMTAVIEEPFPVQRDTQYVFSAWNKIDHEKYGTGEWWVTVSDSSGQVIFREKIETRRSNEIQDMWIRSEKVVPAPRGSKIKAELESPKAIYVDEIFIYPMNAKVILDDPASKEFLYNGFRIEKPGQ